MADVPVEEQQADTCKCIKWHAPKPTRYGKVTVEGETISLCPATFTAVQDAIKIYEDAGGKPKRADLITIPKYPRELAGKMWQERVASASQS